MENKTQHVAIIGANKEGLALLPTLLQDKGVNIECITDSDPNAMLYKLEEMGYGLAEKFDIRVSTDIEILKTIPNLNLIINCVRNKITQEFLQQPLFDGINKLSPLSVRLLWDLKGGVIDSDNGGIVTSKEQLTLLSSMKEIADAVNLTTDRKEVLTVILTLAIEATRAERGSIMLINMDNSTLGVEVARGMDEDVAKKIKVPLGEGIAGKVALDGKPLLLSGKAREEQFKYLRDRHDVKTALCVPLVVNSTVIGVVNVNSSESVHAFTKKDLSFLTDLAALAAEVIHRSQEYNEMKYKETKFELLKYIDSAISSSTPFSKKLATICDRLAELNDGISCFIYLYDEDADKMALSASNIVDMKSVGNFVLGKGKGIEGWVMENREKVILKDFGNSGDRYKIYMTLPMETKGKLVGVLSIQLISTHEPELQFESLFDDVASFLADSIDKIKKEENSKQQINKMFAVDETGLELMSIEDPDRFYLSVAATVAVLVGVEGAVIRLRNNDTSRFRLRGAYGLDDEKIRKSFLPIEKEVGLEVVRAKKAVIRNVLQTEEKYIRSALSHPIILDDKVIGVLTLFNKGSFETVFACSFSKDDLKLVKRFVMYVEKRLPFLASKEAISNEYEFLSTKDFLEKRTFEEISRSKRYDKRFLLLTIRIPDLKECVEETHLIQNILSFIKDKIRKFDIVARLNEESLAVLFLETDERALRVIEEIMRFGFPKEFSDKMLESLGEFSYGYAIFPDDGSTFDELMNKSLHRTNIRVSGENTKEGEA